jgi:acetyltransferase-like isoleucine patch superfamily enzyme
MTAHRLQGAQVPDLSIEGVVAGDDIAAGPELRGLAVALRAATARFRGILRRQASRGRIGGQSPILGSRVSLLFAGHGHAHFGEGVVISPDFHGFFSSAVSFGNGVFVNRGCHFVAMAGLDIGDDVRFGERVSIHDESHIFEPLSETAAHRADYRTKSISIGDRVWVGANVVILPGVRIGADSVVAAGAVVRKDIPAGVLVAGVPATVVRELRH